jgi:hypothetical protein
MYSQNNKERYIRVVRGIGVQESMDLDSEDSFPVLPVTTKRNNVKRQSGWEKAVYNATRQEKMCKCIKNEVQVLSKNRKKIVHRWFRI